MEEILTLFSTRGAIVGAPPEKVDCSKEAVLRKLIYEKDFKGHEVVVIGDGKVEIALGLEMGTITLGVVSDEEKLCRVNPIKRDKLIKTGAHAIIGDFETSSEIIEWLGLNKY